VKWQAFLVAGGITAIAVPALSAGDLGPQAPDMRLAYAQIDDDDMDPSAGQVREERMRTTREPVRPKVSYLLSDENAFGDGPELLWPGFLSGMKTTYTFQEKFVDPIGNPFYFESPFIETNAEIVYVWHDFPTNSAIGGGELNIAALQLRAAITDRLAFIATKDGYSWINTGATGDEGGWNDLAWGLKYALIVDEPNEFILTGGMRWEMRNGDDEVLQGDTSSANELNPFISFAKGWDRFHLLGAVNYRLPVDSGSYNHVLHWDLHADYEIAPETLPGFFPTVEVHGVHYFNNGDVTPLPVGGLDYTNLGSTDTAGDFMMWGDLGFRWKLTPNMDFGAAYGVPLVNPGTDIFNQRVTLRLKVSI
jgi:hypothetical protein